MTRLEVLELIHDLLAGCEQSLGDGHEYCDPTEVVDHKALKDNVEDAILDQWGVAGFKSREAYRKKRFPYKLP